MQVYLDYAATTPLDPAVLEAMLPLLREDFGNPSSLHRYGQRSRRLLETARQQVAEAIGAAARDILFCSGATEADNHALRAVAAAHPQGHIITSVLEHSAVLQTCRQLEAQGQAVTYLRPNAQGEITLEAVRDALRDDTVLVALMFVNNETGVISDIARISELVHEAGALLFCDAVQAFGCLPIDVNELGVDMLSLSAHKAYGPKGVGALYIRPGLSLTPLLWGGEQERGLRAGTHNTAAIVGMGACAARLSQNIAEDAADIAAKRDYLQAALLRGQGVHLNAGQAPRSPKHLNVRVEGVDGEALLVGLDAAGVAVSAGSACAAGSLEPSHVLLAMGLNWQEAKASLRFSLGRGLSYEALDYAAQAFHEVIARCRSVTPKALV